MPHLLKDSLGTADQKQATFLSTVLLGIGITFPHFSAGCTFPFEAFTVDTELTTERLGMEEFSPLGGRFTTILVCTNTKSNRPAHRESALGGLCLTV